MVDIDKLIYKIYRDRENRKAKKILQKKKAGGLILPDFKTYYKALIIKIM